MKIFFVTKKPAIPKIFYQLQVKKTFKMTEFLYMNSTSYNLKQRVCNLQNNLQFLANLGNLDYGSKTTKTFEYPGHISLYCNKYYLSSKIRYICFLDLVCEKFEFFSQESWSLCNNKQFCQKLTQKVTPSPQGILMQT